MCINVRLGAALAAMLLAGLASVAGAPRGEPDKKDPDKKDG